VARSLKERELSFPYINSYQQFFDSSGSPLASGTIEFRDPTSNDLIDTFPTADDADAQTNANANPLTLNASGAAAAGLFLEDGVVYKVILKDSAGATVATHDDVSCPVVMTGATQTAAESSAGVTPTDVSYPEGHVNRYGAVGDDVTDDQAAIQNAVLVAGDNGTVFFSPGLTYRINSGITVPYDDHTWEMGSAIISVNFNGLGILFGETAVRHFRIKVHGGSVNRAGGADWTSGNIGVQFLNTDYCSYKDFDITGFEKGLFLKADSGEGQSYFTGMPTSIISCKYAIYLEPTGVGSFVNENGFFGTGSLSYSSGDPDATGGYLIYMALASGAAPPNNNKFFGLSLENPTVTAGDPDGAIFNNGQRNGWWHCRYEGFADPFISGGSDTLDGFYYQGRGLTGLANIDTANTGFDFVLEGNRVRYYGGGLDGTDPIFVLREFNSNNNVAFRIQSTAGDTVFEIGSDGKFTSGNGGSELGRYLTGTKTFDFPNVADGAVTTTTVTVTNAAVGDLVLVGHSTAIPAGCILSGAVTSTSTVTVTLTNHSGGAVNLDSGTLRASVWQH
jgi:hypothetical protein